MSDSVDYDRNFVGKCELLWGKGFLAPNRGNGIFDIVPPPLLEAKHVLDFGCGLGGPSIALARSSRLVIALDIDPALVAIAMRYAAEAGVTNLTFLVADVSQDALPIAPNSMDVIFSRDAIVHVAEKMRLFLEFSRVAIPGATLALSDWFATDQRERPRRKLEAVIRATGLHLEFTSLGTTISMIQRAGFIVQRCQSRSPWYREQALLDIAEMEGESATQLDALLGCEGRKAWVRTRALLVEAIDEGEFTPFIIQAFRQ